MKKVWMSFLVVLAGVVVLPGIHLVGNAFMLLAEPEYSVPKASSLITFNCTKISEGGNTSYCDYGQDWTKFYAACGEAASGPAACQGDFASFPKAAAKSCIGFQPRDASTWCAQEH